MAVLKIAKELFDIFYPIGSYYETSNTSWTPQNAGWYGTWAEDTSGRILVALDTGDTNFDTIDKVGGSNTHKHSTGDCTLTVSQIPAHSHQKANSWGTAAYVYGYTDTWQYSGEIKRSGVDIQTGSTGGGKAHNHGNTGNANNLMKYKVIRRWHRTA